MDFTISPALEDLRSRIAGFVSQEIIPLESDPSAYDAHENIAAAPLERLRAKARAEGLWCLQLKPENGGLGVGHGDQGDGTIDQRRDGAREAGQPDGVDDRDARGVGYQARKSVESTPRNVHVVGAELGIDGDGHSTAPRSAASWSATSDDPRPSVSTTWVETAS